MMHEMCISDYISYLKGVSPLPDPSVRYILNTMVPSDKSLSFIQSNMPSFISLREPICPLFKEHVNEIHAQELLSGMVDESISPQALLHMDQCMYNYSSINISHMDNIITNMLNIARSYIRREDIKDANDIQSHHRYVIMLASDIMSTRGKDVLMTYIFSTPIDLELVIDFELRYDTEQFSRHIYHDWLGEIFGRKHCIQYISIIGKNLISIYHDFLSRDISSCFFLKSVIIPNGVTHIDDRLLYDCHSLTNIVIPNSVTHIGNCFLRDCWYLTSITMSSSLTYIGNDFLSACMSLTSITIPNSVTHIGNDFLMGCPCDKVVNIPDKITYIGDSFACSKSSRSITIPDSVTHIGERFLYDSDSLI
jgi:hypothetical protein